jgi:hypothetical protein
MMQRAWQSDSAGFWIRRAARAAWPVLGVCLGLAGCQPGSTFSGRSLADLFRPSPPAAVSTASAEPEASDAGSGNRLIPAAALHLSFNVLRTRVPRGTFSESGKIWNHVDEQVVPADLAANLQRNGLRIARGKVASWPPIKALLDAENDITVAQNAMSIGNGLPLTIELDSERHDQTLFLFRRDGTLGGVTLPASMNLLRIEYAIPVTDPDSVLLNVMPEIRLQTPPPKLTTEGWVERPMVPPSRVFRELAVRILIGPEEFLAVGPSPAAHRAHTMGSLLLGQEVEGRRYEYMFFITPRVIRKELPVPANTNLPAAATPTGR